MLCNFGLSQRPSPSVHRDKQDDCLIIQRVSKENAFHGQTGILKRSMYVWNITHLFIYVCEKTSLLQCLFLLQQFRQSIMCFLDLWKDRLIILVLICSLMSFSNFLFLIFLLLFFLKGCFSAWTVYVSAAHSALLEKDDVFCSLTSFTTKPDNCQKRFLALSSNYIRLAYISISSHHAYKL